MRRLGMIVSLIALAVTLGGCDIAKDWLGGSTKKAKLKGDRIPILLNDQEISPDPRIQDVDIALPDAQVNPEWPQAGGSPTHAMQNLALGDSLKQVWEISIGSGRSRERKHLAAPIVGEGRVFTMDSEAAVRAFKADGGGQLWEADLTPENVDKGDLGGGLAYADGVLFATSNFGEVLALDAKTGKINWRRPVMAPTRAAPTVGGGRVFVVTADNQLFAVNAKDGTVLWTHAGLSEVTGLLGAASPAYEGGIVVVPYTSGELYALRADNGRVLWSDTLAAIRRVNAVAGIADIRGQPVIDHDRVIAIANSARMVAIDLRSGGRVWEDPIGGMTMPWVAGDFIYVLANDNQLICLTRSEGRVRWVVQLDRWANPEKKEDPILWIGPVLAGGKLMVGSTDNRLVALSPSTGEIVGTIDTSDPVSVPPIVAGGTLYVLTDAGDLRAYR